MLLFFLAAVVLAMWILPFWNENIRDNIYWEFSKWIVQVATFCVAVLVAVGEMWQDWGSQLPKKLTVFFEHDNRTLMVCKDVYLSSEGDIRQWGMQLGRQMMGGSAFLNFDPFIRQEFTGSHDVNGELCNCYCVHFRLLELPERQSPKPPPEKDAFVTDEHSSAEEKYSAAQQKHERNLRSILKLNEIIEAGIGETRRCRIWELKDGEMTEGWIDNEEEVTRHCRR